MQHGEINNVSKDSEIGSIFAEPVADKVAETDGGPVAAPDLGSIKFCSVSKRFKKNTVSINSYDTVKSSILRKFFDSSIFKPKVTNYQQVLNNIDFEVKPGSSIGIIGRNGSGKSTILKLISGIYRPDSGEIISKGKISALIELGAGFHPDFTGRENIYLGGVIFGMSRSEIDSKFDQIVDYAGLRDFIDDPVRTYSSGMYMRLGFSLAIHTDPDILIIDEVLAVGDTAFVKKCFDSIREFRRRGKTLIFVAHDLDAVQRWCDRVLWLSKGSIVMDGKPEEVVRSYLDEIRVEEEEELEKANQQKAVSGSISGVDNDRGGERWGDKSLEIKEITLLNGKREAKWTFSPHERITVRVSVRVNRPIEELVCGFAINRTDGLVMMGTNTQMDNVLKDEIGELVGAVNSDARLVAGDEFSYEIDLASFSLMDGHYYIDAAVHKKDGTPFDYIHQKFMFSVVESRKPAGLLDIPRSWNLIFNRKQD